MWYKYEVHMSHFKPICVSPTKVNRRCLRPQGSEKSTVNQRKAG